MRRVLALAMLVGTCLLASRAAADVELRGEPSSIDAATLDSLVRLELGDARASKIIVDVKGKQADVEVEVGFEKRRGTIDLPERDVERTIALFAAELARTVDVPKPKPDAPPAPSERPAEPPSSDDARLAILATMGARVLFSGGALFLTPRAEVGLGTDAFQIGGTGRYGYTSADDQLGTVRGHLVAFGVAGTQHIAPRSTLGFSHGPRIEAGFITARGDGSNGSSATSFSAAASWEGMLRVQVARPIALLLGLDIGLLFFGLDLRADDRRVVRLSGAFAGASAGLAF